jgi:hypothetical protein
MKTAILAVTLMTTLTAHPAAADEVADAPPTDDMVVADDQVEQPIEVEDWRVDCIEMKESGGANVANFRGSGAVGVLQYMPRTFYAHAAEMLHWDWSPWVPWQARAVAAHDLALGRRRQWAVGGC